MKIHSFSYSSTAFDAANINLSVQNGDVLVVESEQIVAVACTWPFAVTVNRSEMNDFTLDEPITKPQVLMDFVNSIRAAVAEAKRLNYEVNPDFAGFSLGHQ